MKNVIENLFSIGYGNRSINDFFNLLHKYEIKYLIDVRSIPYSKYNGDFQKKQLEGHSCLNKVNYSYMGNVLGGRPEEESDYQNGKVGYDLLGDEESFKNGIQQLIKYCENKSSVVLMCSEIKPENCHRSKLIGRALKKYGIEISHIDEVGNLKSQDEVMNIVTKGLGEYDLFGEKPLSSRKKYTK